MEAGHRDRRASERGPGGQRQTREILGGLVERYRVSA
jgi:hypothetical protein